MGSRSNILVCIGIGCTIEYRMILSTSVTQVKTRCRRHGWSIHMASLERCGKAWRMCVADDGLPSAKQPGKTKPEIPGSGPGGYRRPTMSRPVGEENSRRPRRLTPSVVGLDTVTTPFSVEITLSIRDRAGARLEQLRESTCSLTIAGNHCRLLLSTIRTGLSIPMGLRRCRCQPSC